ncbi:MULTISPECIES: methyltransferase family protein [unclassified Rhizobium]|uniref:methyltransferase family protein n=1 Tax=unclassified Rhizobium TaxID=2613769 RepID=UPI000715A282|nr:MULTISPECIES: isoprenylcysteine carboxylmethyltransferase family protein [unclassified Rhizobium]KQS88280.1 isoprenylcysteine carboxyl methyltransferase [Rhizobium sp. Leaf391]KQT03871.1 isoprenylcysteine carboxyl methyltransferase [Rhizobium sp. Leaf386]KQT95667.1 isoprenylcysteine carboxyl methyltransferase [Rhizobium sp. Leaf453]
MNAYRAKPMTYPWPPALYLVVMLCAVMLGRWAPISVSHSHGWAPWLAGAALITMAVSLDIWAMKTLIERHTAVMPHRCSSHLVTCGPFRYTRNPIYLGYTILMVGFGLINLNPWFIIMASVAVPVTTAFAVRNEELHLLSRYGFEFERYCRATNRWI